MSLSTKCLRPVHIPAILLALLPAAGWAQCTASFTYRIGDASAAPASQACILTAGSVVLSYTASASAGWIQVSPPSGSVAANGSANLTISVAPGGLAAGSYQGNVAVTAPGYQSMNIPVYVTVSDPQNPIISANPGTLAFTYQRGSSIPAPQTLTVSSSGTALNYSVSVQGAAWLAVNASSGATPGSVTLSVDPAGLADNTYTGLVVIQASGSANGSVTVPVSLTVSAAPPIALSRASLAFTYALGDPVPTSQTVSVTSSPSGAAFAVSADSESSGWLQFSADTTQTPATITVAVTPNSLLPGAYNSTIRVTSPASGAQTLIQVSLNVAGTISFTYQPATDPPKAKCFTLNGPAGQPFAISTSGQPWFSVQPSQMSTPASICVSVTPQNLAQGDYSGTVSMAPGQLQLTVALKVLALPSLQLMPGALTFAPQPPGTSIPSHRLIVFSANPDRGVQFNVGISPDAPWLQASAQSGTTPAYLTFAASADGLQPGTYATTITISLAGVTAGPQTVPVTLEVPTPATATSKAQSSLIPRPTALSFSYQPGFTLPLSQILAISGGSTPVSVATSTLNGGSWLTVSPAGATTPATLTIAVNPQGLAPDTYKGAIVLQSSESSVSGVTVPVTFTVTAGATPTVSPSSLSLEAQAGAAQPASGRLVVNTNGNALIISATTTGGPWLSVDPTPFAVGSLDTSTSKVVPWPSTRAVFADASGLAPGTYSGSVLLSPNNSSAPVTVPVTFTVRSNTLIVPQVADGGGWKTSVFLVNTDSVPAPFTVRFLAPDGTPLAIPLEGIGRVTEYANTIPVGGSQLIQTQGADASLAQGWAEVVAQASLGGTAVFRQGNGVAASEAAVSVSPPIGKQFSLPFDNTKGFVTAMAIVNPGLFASTMSVTVQDETGQVLTTDSVPMDARSRQAFTLPGQFPQSGGHRGVITFSNATNDVAAFGLRFNPLSSFTSIQAIPQVSATGETTTRSIPQVADGSNWKTTIFLVNPTLEPAPYSLTFRQADGSPLNLPLLGLGPTYEYSDVIPGGGVRILESDGTSGALLQGWAEVVSTKPVMGTAVFRQRSAAGLDSEAAVQVAPSAGDRIVLPFDNTQGFVTALAVVNEDGAKTLQLQVVIRDENGERILNTLVSLQPHDRQAFTMPNQFPASTNQRGTIEFSGSDFSVLGLRFNPRGTFTSITPLPK